VRTLASEGAGDSSKGTNLARRRGRTIKGEGKGNGKRGAGEAEVEFRGREKRRFYYTGFLSGRDSKRFGAVLKNMVTGDQKIRPSLNRSGERKP